MHWSTVLRFKMRAEEDTVEAYTLPQGALSELMREMAAGRPGLFSQVGLHTFVDPRMGGGVRVNVQQKTWLNWFHSKAKNGSFINLIKVDIAFLRGTTADEDGNVTMEREAVFGEMLSMAQAIHRTGGIVIVQVARLGTARNPPCKAGKNPWYAGRPGGGRSDSAANLCHGLFPGVCW